MTKFGTLNPDGTVTNEMEIDLDSIESNDPIAYGYGLFHGRSGGTVPDPETEEYSELALEYIRGVIDGQKEVTL